MAVISADRTGGSEGAEERAKSLIHETCNTGTRSPRDRPHLEECSESKEEEAEGTESPHAGHTRKKSAEEPEEANNMEAEKEWRRTIQSHGGCCGGGGETRERRCQNQHMSTGEYESTRARGSRR